MSRTVAIVDPYDAGVLLAPAFGAQGVASVMVPSTAELPRDQAAFDPTPFRHVLVWTEDVDAIVAALRDEGVGRVLAGSERGVMLADRLSERLGLPGNGTRLSAARRDKYRMIETVGAQGIRAPRQMQSDDLDGILAWASGCFPVVLKPRAAQGSEGVRLCRSADEVRLAFDGILGRIDRFGVRNRSVLAQEFLPGREYVVDTVSESGVHRLAALWIYGKPAPDFEAVGRLSTKTLLPPGGALGDMLFGFARRVLDALEIRFGAGHCEIVVDDSGPALIEIGARLHGGPPAHLQCRAATGTSQLDLLVQSCADPDAFRAGPLHAYALQGGASMALLRDDALRGELERLPSAERVVWNAPSDPPPQVAGLATLIHIDRDVVAADLEIATGAIACEVFTDRAHIETIADDWRALLDRSRCNRAFGGPAWYLAALEAALELSPALVACHRAGRLAGVLPLARDRSRDTARFATILSDYNDAVVADGDMAAARRLLIHARTRFAALELTCVRADSNLALAEAGRAVLVEKTYPCPFADISGGYPAWLAARPAPFRRQLGQRARRAAQGGATVARLDPAQEDSERLTELFLRLHRARFGERSQFHRDPLANAFVRHALPRLLADGSAIAFGFRANGDIVGINICMRGAGSLGYWNAGFEPAWTAFSPGVLMLHAALREACAMGLAEFDLLRGREPYKLKWSSAERGIGRLE